jgi:hypothetical protein
MIYRFIYLVHLLKKITVIIIVISTLILIVVTFISFYYKHFYPYQGNAPPITDEELKSGRYYGFYN